MNISLPATMAKLPASVPPRVSVLLLPLASGSVTVKVPISTPVPTVTFSAMVLADSAMSVGTSLTLVTLTVTIFSVVRVASMPVLVATMVKV